MQTHVTSRPTYAADSHPHSFIATSVLTFTEVMVDTEVVPMITTVAKVT